MQGAVDDATLKVEKKKNGGSRWGFKRVKQPHNTPKKGVESVVVDKKRPWEEEESMDVDESDRMAKVGNLTVESDSELLKNVGPVDWSCWDQ
jgi:hypothetical protein